MSRVIRRGGEPAAEPGVRILSSGNLLLALQATLLVLMTASVVTKTWQDRLWLGFVLVGATVAVWAPELTRDRARRWWFVYVAGIFFYTLLRAYADETLIATHTSYVIDSDKFLFLGTLPVAWLQPKLFSLSHVSWYDIAAVQVHWSFFIAPHLMAVIIFVRRRKLFPGYALLVVGTMYAGLALFFLLPTTPPWLAASQGNIDNVYRVMDFVGGHVNSSSYQSFHAALAEPNSVAAMPSIHMGVTFAMYLWARKHAPKVAWPMLVYCGIMGLALVYLAEHYVTDLLVGMVCATVCYWIAERVTAPRRDAATAAR